MCINQQRTYLSYVPYKEMRIPKEVRDRTKKMELTKGGQTRWLSYFQALDGGADLLVRVFAVNKTKARGTEILEVMRETVGGTYYLQRHVYHNGMSGWTAYFPRENEIVPNDWDAWPIDRMPNVWMELINPETVFSVDKFKYCGYRGGFPLGPYLRMYLEEPGIEFFAKIGLQPTKKLVATAKRDPNFRKWIRKLTAEEVERANMYGPNAVVKAYQLKTTNFGTVACDLADKARKSREITAAGARSVIQKGKWKAEKVFEYIHSTANANLYSYGDYIRACDYLHLDLKDTKVAFPREFRRMHDLRIQEMQSRRAAEDAEKRKELYEQFRAVAETVKPYECSANGLAIIIPMAPSELVKEGEALGHCVGRMGYDKKEASRKSFIAFLRNTNKIEQPFVTIEFSFSEKKVLQCYGTRDSKPSETVLAFVEQWAQVVAKALRQQEKEEAERKLAEEAAEIEQRIAAAASA